MLSGPVELALQAREYMDDSVGELPKKAERSDGQCVGARFIAPAGPGGDYAAQFTNRVMDGGNGYLHRVFPVIEQSNRHWRHTFISCRKITRK